MMRHLAFPSMVHKAEKADDFFMSTSVLPRLQESSRALLHKEDPLSGLPFTCCPTSFHSRFEAQSSQQKSPSRRNVDGFSWTTCTW